MKRAIIQWAGIMALFTINMGCTKEIKEETNSVHALGASASGKVPQALKDFTQVNLVADVADYNPVRVDPVLVNAWGIAWSPTGTAWISATGTSKSTVYNKEGGQQLAPVNIPSPGGNTGGLPTGQVFNPSSGFLLPNGQAARFIFAGIPGVISGWNGGNPTQAIKMIDKSATSVYLGLAYATNAGNSYIYAANFRAGRVDVFNSLWQEVMTMSFTDPDLPAGYSPYNIQAIDNKLFVLYAKPGPDGHEIKHPGFGIVSIFNTDGSFDRRFASNGQLNAPWGIAKAPATFYGSEGMSNTYLVGNFGDGRINAYNSDGAFLGQLRAHGEPLIIDGLWALSFAPTSATAIDPNRLYFTAGPGHEEHGLFGYIIK